jgi:myo-inositol-1(or 4)-monophosphatase
MSASLADLMAVAQRAIDLAAPIIASRRPTTVTSKGDRDMVSDLDLTVQDRVRAFLEAETPDIRFLGEEQPSAPFDFEAPVWALDPIDGTANLVRGIPLCGVSLALVEHNRPVLGVIDLPLLDLRYSASRGAGAFGNGRQLHTSATMELREAIVSIGDFAVGTEAEAMNRLQLGIVRRLAPTVLRIRMLGSAAIDLAWLASGKTDINVTLSNRAWDVGAGVIIAQEAGAEVMDLDGSPYTLGSIATLTVTPQLREPLLQVIGAAVRDTGHS